MRKFLQSLFLLLSAAIIAAGAFLPEILSSAMDYSERQNHNSAPMESVVLDLHAETEYASDTAAARALQDMAVYQKTTSVPIGTGMTSMSADKAIQAAEHALEPYQNAGILTYFNSTSSYAEPYIFLDPDNPSRSIIIWAVTFVREGKGLYQSILVHITDFDGKLLYLAADSLDADIWEVNYPSGQTSSQQQVLDAVCMLYLDELGLTETMIGSNSAIKDGSDSTGLRRYCTIYDEALGTSVQVEFFLSSSTLAIQIVN